MVCFQVGTLWLITKLAPIINIPDIDSMGTIFIIILDSSFMKGVINPKKTAAERYINTAPCLVRYFPPLIKPVAVVLYRRPDTSVIIIPVKISALCSLRISNMICP